MERIGNLHNDDEEKPLSSTGEKEVVKVGVSYDMGLGKGGPVAIIPRQE